MLDLKHDVWPTDKLHGYAGNPRKNDAVVDRMVESIKEFGFRIPIVAQSDGLVVDGHLRLKAAKAIGLESVPVVLADDLTDAQIKAFRILANKSVTWAEWDNDLLRIELGALDDMDFDLSLLGFEESELVNLLNDPTEGLTDPDEIPESPDPITQPGDVWVLGKHRLVCGDSTDADDVAKCLNGVEPHLMVTDPPYGVEYDPTWRQQRGVNKAGPGAATGTVVNDDRADWREAWTLFPGDVAYVWHAGLHANEVADSLIVSGFAIRAQIIWNKSSMLLGRGDYHWKHEPCWYAVRKNRNGRFCGGRKQSTVWEIDKPRKSETGHSTQKPVECMKRPIENNSSPGQAVYEPFSGSGTTIIAAEMTGRSCHAIELSPSYCDIAVKRWENFTGQTATLEPRSKEHEQGNETLNTPRQHTPGNINTNNVATAK